MKINISRFFTSTYTIVHCITEDQADMLLEWANRLGFRWNNHEPLITKQTCWEKYKDSTCYRMDFISMTVGFAPWNRYYETIGNLIEFGDVIVDEESNERKI